MLRPRQLAVALAALCVPWAVAANPVKSLYTSVDLKACKLLKQHRDGNSWLCSGLPGFPVYVAEGDLRQFVSMGPDAERRRAAAQTLGPFNSIFERNKERAAIEWRFVTRRERPIPYAAIIRFHTFHEGRRGDVLVVFRVGERDTCHVAYIDALANSDAIVLARQIADTRARTFDCRAEPVAAGEKGRSPM
jgi:hypothetical protein